MATLLGREEVHGKCLTAFGKGAAQIACSPDAANIRNICHAADGSSLFADPSYAVAARSVAGDNEKNHGSALDCFTHAFFQHGFHPGKAVFGDR